MVDVHELERPDRTTGEPAVPSRPRLFVASVAHTWVLVVLGGGICGALSVNYTSVIFLYLTVPVGFVLAGTSGLPVIVSLALWLTFHRPGPDPRRFVLILQLLGASIALAINGTTNLWFLQGGLETSASSSGDPLTWMLVLAAGLACVAASGFVGWMCGATLAQSHLVAIHHPTAAARRAARRRRPWR